MGAGKSVAQVVRQVCVKSLPFATVLGVGAGALAVQKRYDPPEIDFFDHRATFSCASHSELGVAREQLFKTAGAEADALKRSARRVRGPLERDFIAVEHFLACTPAQEPVEGRRQRLHRLLLDAWRRAGYCAEPEHRTVPQLHMGVDLVTQQDESYGRDLGVEVPLCLFRESGDQEVCTLSVEDWKGAAAALREHGVVRLKHYLTQSQVREFRDRLNMKESQLDKRRGAPHALLPIREFNSELLLKDDPNIEERRSGRGRRHFYVRNRSVGEALKDLQAGVLPLAWEWLVACAGCAQERQCEQGSSTEKTQDIASPPMTRLPYISETQILVAEPSAQKQLWHMDNRAPGLTLYIPLTDVPSDTGPTVFLPGTHHFFDRESGYITRAKRFCRSFLVSCGTIEGALSAGDAILYDSRVIHHSSENCRLDRCCVAVVFRYDVERPPGMGVFGAQLVAWTGGILGLIQRFYGQLPC